MDTGDSVEKEARGFLFQAAGRNGSSQMDQQISNNNNSTSNSNNNNNDDDNDMEIMRLKLYTSLPSNGNVIPLVSLQSFAT